MSQLYVKIFPNGYRDSVQLLYASSVMAEVEGVENANLAMGSENGKNVFKALEMENETVLAAKSSDLIAAAICDSEETFLKAIDAAFEALNQSQTSGGENAKVYPSQELARKDHPEAQVCLISVPGEYAKAEAERALNAGMHVILFSSHISGEDERALKELAREKGLFCMGPDCGVVNLNGAAILLASITNPGPFGICGASGVGIQHVGALLHAAGSGVTQMIGTGGGDLKKPVGGISMLMGIDALEADPATKYIILISRKPEEKTMNAILERVKQCKKPVVLWNAAEFECPAAAVKTISTLAPENTERLQRTFSSDEDGLQQFAQLLRDNLKGVK